MIALDTNVIVRFLVRDDEKQAHLRQEGREVSVLPVVRLTVSPTLLLGNPFDEP